MGIIVCGISPTRLFAQSATEVEELSEEILREEELRGMDATLFHINVLDVDPYSDATKYYRPQLSQRRRGLDWWVVDDFVEPLKRVVEPLESLSPYSRVRLYGSTRGYQVGASAEFASTTRSGWNLRGDVDMRLGSDANVEGLFREQILGEFSASREFSRNHHLLLSIDAPIITRGLQSDASEEAITLTGDNLYNPSWGIYDGEVRNSRIARYATPQLSLNYQRPIADATHLVARFMAKAGRTSTSRLAWFDGYNPWPDYYQKLPSYAPAGDQRQEVEQMWRSGDTDYTQIGWERLVAINQLSADGSAHYIVEQQVEVLSEGMGEVLFSSDVGGGVDLIYGVRGEWRSGRNFKEVDDLLGAEYLLDHDLYIGDYAYLGNDMQNDMRNPDRKVTAGERFGYDYTARERGVAAVLALDYRTQALSLMVRGEFGEQTSSRIGHYEKERFAGELSYGESDRVSMANNSLNIAANYSLSGRHHLSARATLRQLPIDHRDLFIQVQCANRIVDNPSPRVMRSVGLGYRYESPDFILNAEAYLLSSRNETQVWSYYDDLSYTYSNVVCSGVGSRSVGLDLVAKYRVSKRLNWDIALAVGDFTYDCAPEVKLYDDVTMELFSTSQATAVEGSKVGNAPQVLLTSSLTFFVNYGLILSLDCSYGGCRYIAPSFTRRTDRVVLSANSPEMERQIVEQERLPDVYDATLSATKTWWLHGDNRISLNLRINNLFGDANRVEYGREANRILTTSDGSSSDSRYLEPSSYVYGTPRTLYISCSYSF